MKYFLPLLFIVCCSSSNKVIEPIKKVDTTQKIIALTFDDGPRTGVTEQFLELLEKENLKVTFFNLGKKIKANPELAKKVIEQGHEIGNHSYTHAKLTDFKDSLKIFSEINMFQKIAKSLLNYIPKLFRAPYLEYDKKVISIISQLNLKLIDAEVFCRDAKPNVDPHIIIQNVLNNVSQGAIILGHEREHTVEALKTIIPELRKRGYKFVTVSELLTIVK